LANSDKLVKSMEFSTCVFIKNGMFISLYHSKWFALLLYHVFVSSDWLFYYLSDRSPDIDNYSDDDEPHDYNDNEDWSGDDLSDLEPMMDEDSRPRPRKTSHGPIRQVTSRVRKVF
jgi:hypothetical protein